MSHRTHTFHFAIDAFEPATLPMASLAEYLKHLANLLGEKDHVHFERVQEGSAVLAQHVDEVALPGVRQRLEAVGRADAPDDVRKADQELNARLAKDNARASLRQPDGETIVSFPGIDRPAGHTWGPLREHGVLDGVLIRVGGKGDTVPVHLQDSDRTHICQASREMARSLAPHLFGATIRVHGEGRWTRTADERWRLLDFEIHGFQPLDDAPLGDVVQRLRGVKGSGWSRIAEPARELQLLREGPAGKNS